MRSRGTQKTFRLPPDRAGSGENKRIFRADLEFLGGNMNGALTKADIVEAIYEKTEKTALM